MFDVLAQMAALIACGVAWRATRPFGMSADEVRPAITGVVYILLLPALILLVLWEAPLGTDSLRIAGSAATGVLASMLIAWLTCRLCGARPAVTGAVLLAASFPNATYLGLPVLEGTYGEWARSVAIQYDLFACTPLVLTVGILIAQIHGDGRAGRTNPLIGLLRVPPLWAAVAAVVLNAADVPLPVWLHDWLDLVGSAVVPLMLIGLGMGLRWDTWRWSAVPVLAPVFLIQLLIMPAIVFAVARALGLAPPLFAPVVTEAAMPSMVLGVVFADRYGLDTGLYAAAVTACTALAMLTLPVWYGVLTG